MVDGVWGFSSTSDFSPAAIERAVKRATECGRSLSQVKKAAIKTLPQTELARGEFILSGYDELKKMSLEEKMDNVLKAEAHIRNRSSLIQSSSCGYNEQFEDKIIVTTDGAMAISRLCRNEIRLSAIAASGGEMAEGQHTVGRSGTWNCLFSEHSLDQMGEEAAKLAVDLLKAPKIPGGMATLILSPAMVGLLSHEAIGHTVEADFVLSGSVAQGKLGQQVASPLVNLCDAGFIQDHPFAGGALLVDDEGVPTQNTMIIKNGILNSYLHNRESAAAMGVAPTGNARAWLYQDEPLIRMRNTFILPGDKTLQQIIESTEDGYLVDCPLGGQADATGEFMFGA
ncbi:TldD/PmbA family protein, partial [bacterium]|nr:TldD/PmbA family protein [bacterium]